MARVREVHNFPLRVPVIVRRWVVGVPGELGNYPKPALGDPEDWLVVGVEPPVSSEPELAGRDRVVVDAKMYAPIEIALRPNDRVTVRGMEFGVIGYPQDADLGPWWDLPLTTVLLKGIEAL